ncbi:MAG: hypothetical protein D6791_12930 [Chloroflexi bacterium]|nr:MAG: hypothetical protein D6791_12930 [Chloroflexota bacterium]
MSGQKLERDEAAEPGLCRGGLRIVVNGIGKEDTRKINNRLRKNRIAVLCNSIVIQAAGIRHNSLLLARFDLVTLRLVFLGKAIAPEPGPARKRAPLFPHTGLLMARRTYATVLREANGLTQTENLRGLLQASSSAAKAVGSE